MVTKYDVEISACCSAPIVPLQLRPVFSYLLTDINECESNPCENGATCIEKVGSYSCDCVAGFIGVNCEIGKSECLMASKDHATENNDSDGHQSEVSRVTGLAGYGVFSLAR